MSRKTWFSRMRIGVAFDGNSIILNRNIPSSSFYLSSPCPSIMEDSAKIKMETVAFKSDTFPVMNFIKLNATRNLWFYCLPGRESISPLNLFLGVTIITIIIIDLGRGGIK